MDQRKYIGHESQLFGVEEHRLVGGKGDGMRLFQMKNGKGVELTVLADRCADIARLSFKGMNMGYFSPCGYVAPAYYDDQGLGFLKSFTAGFLTTCGLRAAGSPCEDQGETFPLHGTAGNLPAEHIYWEEEEDGLHVKALIRDEHIFAPKMVLKRDICCSLEENKVTIHDKVINRGDTTEPVMLLYHMNMGYPLLNEKSQLYIPSQSVAPRDDWAAQGLDSWSEILEPQAGFAEQCFYHKFEGIGKAGIFNPETGLGLLISFDTEQLPYFTQWKMLGERDYVMGLEPGNCYPDGRAVMRERGELSFLEPGQAADFVVTIQMVDGADQWNTLTTD